MESLFRFVAPPSQCGYLPGQRWSLEYEYVAEMTPAEYLGRLLAGWRRFGTMLFHPACPACSACHSLRVRAGEFRPDRSQRRTRKANEGVVQLRVGPPSVTRAKLALYDSYHAHQARARGWPEHPVRDSASYADSFVHHPYPEEPPGASAAGVEEWCYFLGGRLVGVGYVDRLADPSSGGLSAIYFFYDPTERQRSLGTWNVLCLLDEAVRRGLPYVYLGYYVGGCRSMEYKARFVPNEVLGADGVWREFRP